MIKISAHIQKKLPLPGYEYSSQSFSAGLEVEASDADSPEVIKHRVQQLYAVLEDSVNTQIAAATETNGHKAEHDNGSNGRSQPGSDHQERRSHGRDAQTRAQYRRNGNGNGRRRVGSTDAQRRAIFALCREQGIEMADVLADFNVTDARDLSVMDASKLIDELKSRTV